MIVCKNIFNRGWTENSDWTFTLYIFITDRPSKAVYGLPTGCQAQIRIRIIFVVGFLRGFIGDK